MQSRLKNENNFLSDRSLSIKNRQINELNINYQEGNENLLKNLQQHEETRQAAYLKKKKAIDKTKEDYERNKKIIDDFKKESANKERKRGDEILKDYEKKCKF